MNDEQKQREEKRLEKSILRNFEGDMIGIGDIFHYWNNDGRWCCFQVDLITISEDGKGEASGSDQEGARHWADNHRCFSTSDEDKAHNMWVKKREDAIREMRHREYKEGWQAFWDKVTEDKNPYKPGAECHQRWSEGWGDAEYHNEKQAEQERG